MTKLVRHESLSEPWEYLTLIQTFWSSRRRKISESSGVMLSLQRESLRPPAITIAELFGR